MLRDPMTQVNMDMVHDVCYRGLFHLDEAVAHGQPAGLKTLGNWKTFYEGLSLLPEQARKSWLAFDHYYSDQAFPAALPWCLPIVPGDCSMWVATRAVGRSNARKHDPDVHITIADLPQQLEFARATDRATRVGIAR